MTKDELERKLEEMREIAGIYPRGYHLRSISNFLKHSERIRSKDDLAFVYENLNAYINLMSEGGPISTVESAELYHKYLSPIGRYYVANLGFSVFVKPWILVVFISVSCLIPAIFEAPRIVYLIVVSIFFIYYMYQLYKMHRGELYGFLF